MYLVTITELGETVEPLLDEKMLVLFGPTVPEELKEICAVHNGEPTEQTLLAIGGTIAIGDASYKISEVGDAANINFTGLGHLTILFGSTAELLPGSVRVTSDSTPALSVGTTIVFS
ncbi:PTS glucitol/sorbitol transporter subunit IIA [Atopobium fossor]|uniref:PTS glucitol/sorbitol transporter subunit IIA n=1 Tax=Atopobium fossor TaxID=39487 RepID=UPI000486A4D2|nr:PTS glucitol/sorbitol transporter subunit IIA [Atopobium fossor]